MTIQQQLAALQQQVQRLASIVNLATSPPSHEIITRVHLTAAVNAALISLMPAPALTDWGLTAMYDDTRTNKMNSVAEMRLFSGAAATQTQPVFCGGAGALLQVSASGSGHIDAMWGMAGVFPYLVTADIPFFNGQIPCVSPHIYMPALYAGLRQCSKAIIVCHPPPWSSYLEAALCVYFIAGGSPHVAVLLPPNLVAHAAMCADEPATPNIPGTFNGVWTKRDRRVDVARILTELMAAYCNAMPHNEQRVFTAIHAALPQGPWSLLDDIQRSAAGIDRDSTLAYGIRNNLFAPAPQVSAGRRSRWRGVLQNSQTDIGVCLHYIYILNMVAENPDNEARYDISKVSVPYTIACVSRCYRCRRLSLRSMLHLLSGGPTHTCASYYRWYCCST